MASSKPKDVSDEQRLSVVRSKACRSSASWTRRTRKVTPQSALGKAVHYLPKVNTQEPYTWLCHLLEQLRHVSSVEVYEALLPWNCSPEMGCKRLDSSRRDILPMTHWPPISKGEQA